MKWSAALILFLAPLGAQTLHISGGATDYQVFQRIQDPNGYTAGVRVELSGDASGLEGHALEVRVNDIPQTLDKSARIHNSVFRVPVSLSVGGPWTIEVEAPGTTAKASVHDLLVGDLWVLAGQSNMEGVGDLVDTETPDPHIHNFDQMDHWVVAQDPLHNLPGAVDRVHWRKNAQGQPERLEGKALADFNASRRKGAGLGLPFAKELWNRTQTPIGLISCAHGGTSMDEWSPDGRDRGGDTLYGSMYRRVKSVGGHVRGVLWYQGESDADPQRSGTFQEKFEKFVTRVRADFGDSNLPFYYVQIGRFVNDTNERDWNKVQQAQLDAESRIPHSVMFASVDSELDDLIHVGTPNLKLLGRRMAMVAAPQSSGQTMLRGPRPLSATLDGTTVRVTFSDVNDGLRAPERIAGFSIRRPDGAYLPLIFRSKVDPLDPRSVLLLLTGKPPDGAVLHYGYGKDPFCNLRDGQGFPVPVFGPMVIGVKN